MLHLRLKVYLAAIAPTEFLDLLVVLDKLNSPNTNRILATSTTTVVLLVLELMALQFLAQFLAHLLLADLIAMKLQPLLLAQPLDAQHLNALTEMKLLLLQTSKVKAFS
ncbi:hypothetical protein BT63DRAFT_427924 [Microthyrium microscopicum]|uniref:Uncharacterized protein n=1 Tax=Microthyrium microscopicum TaxID=703497 RepID=A0A6A6U3G6_9PEZI|nr:hypothetical protein BT63DRAFT_427924 [Microthyrium microscopicum]